jgi:hypothetical protein
VLTHYYYKVRKIFKKVLNRITLIWRKIQQESGQLLYLYFRRNFDIFCLYIERRLLVTILLTLETFYRLVPNPVVGAMGLNNNY